VYTKSVPRVRIPSSPRFFYILQLHLTINKTKSAIPFIMKKFFSLALVATLILAPSLAYAQAASDEDDNNTEVVAEESQSVSMESMEAVSAVEEEAVVEKGFRETLKEKFIEGGYQWMTPLLICLILGLAIAFERVIFLNMSTINTSRFMSSLESAIKSGGVAAGKELCRNTPGPIASILYEGLNRSEEGVDTVEKAVVSYGGVEMGKMEKSLPWLSLFIALAPMLGFLGTVIGMIEAFDQIEAAGDISPTVVAGGIKVALLTTVGGLLVAIILQIFYNYIMSKIEGLVNEMEEASINFIDILIKSGSVGK
jgi:biopolymer transport protein ExbB